MPTKKESPKIQEEENSILSQIKTRPATELMKKVAEAAPSDKKLKKTFTPEEIAEILSRKAAKDKISKTENYELNKATRANKRWVKDVSTGDYGRIFLYPSYSSNDGKVWYKMTDFSALYFVYRLSERMGMNVKLYPDSDTFVKAIYVASVPDVEAVARKFMELGGRSVDVAQNGVYILTLKEPLTVDDYSDMLRAETERRDRLKNMLKPRAAKPVTYTLLNQLIKQFSVQINHIDKRLFFSVGQDLMTTLVEILNIYYMYSDGFIEKAEAGRQMMQKLNFFKAGLATLQELNAWNNIAVAARLGDSLMLLRREIETEFKPRSVDGAKS